MDAPAVAVRDGQITVAWMDRRQGTADVWWAMATRGRFQPEALVHATPAGNQGHPHLVATPEGVVAAWTDAAGIRVRWEDGTEAAVSAADEPDADCGRLTAAGRAVWIVYQVGSGADARAVLRRLR